LRKAKSSSERESLETLATALSPLASLLLRGKVSTSFLVRAAKVAYLRASISELHLSGMRPNISRLAVITGMTRKEVASLLRFDDAQPSALPLKRPLEHRAIRVLRGWETDPLYRTTVGSPADLPFKGEGRDFASLVRAYGGDVTPVAVLRELERLKAVTRSSSGALRLRSRKRGDSLGPNSQLRDFSRLLEGFSRTVLRCLSEEGAPLYLGFRELQLRSAKQAEIFKQSFGRRAALLLDGVGHWESRHRIAKGRLLRHPEDKASMHQVGLGVYLVHTETDSERRGTIRKR
jgi:hypothetical protein